MKKTFILFVAMLWTSTMFIHARTPQEAAQAARDFVAERQMTQAGKLPNAQRAAQMVQTPVELAFTQYQIDETTPAVYVFNTNDDKGFVLVSAEDNARTILGYADQGYFDAEDIPENMQFWLQMYADELRRLDDEASTPSVSQKAKAASSYPVIQPILGDVKWGQGTPYNNLAPTINGEKTPAGCVATAAAQIMYVHKHPTRGTGSKTYTTNTHKKTLSANFGNTTYDWANMLPNYKGNYTSTQASAIATLLYHVGVASGMDYIPGGSGAVSIEAMIGLVEYFDYDKSMRFLTKDYMTETDMLQGIAEELKTGRPIFMQGGTVNNEGHAFVCDGMDSDGFLHINWGWNGSSDGYFALSALDPENQGTGGSASDLAFVVGVEAIIGIQPNQGGEYIPYVLADAVERTSGDQIGRNDYVEMTITGTYNYGLSTLYGSFGYLIYDSNDELVAQVGIVGVGSGGLQPLYGFSSYNFIGQVPSSLSAGDYTIELGFIDKNNQGHSIPVRNRGVVRIPMTITSSNILFGDAIDDQEDYSIQQLEVLEIDDMQVTFAWKTNAAGVEMRIFDSSNKLLGKAISTDTQRTFTAPVEGTYTIQVRPVNAQEVYLGDAVRIEVDVRDFALKNWDVYTEGETMHASWESQATYYHVRLTNNNGTTIADQVINYSKIYIDLYEGDYTLWVRPMDATQSYYVASAMEEVFTIGETQGEEDYSIKNFEVTVIGSYMSASWESDASYFHVKITKDDGSMIADQIIDFKTPTIELEEGNYTIWVRPVDEAQEYYVGDAVEANFSIVDCSIQNLSVTTNGNNMTATWESPAPNFQVKILKEDGTTVTDTIISERSFSYELEEGNYIFWIRPVDEALEYYVASAVEQAFTIEAVDDTDYSIKNFEVTVIGSYMSASWESDASYFHVKISKDDGSMIADQIIDYKTPFIELELGNYTIWVRPVDEAQEYYVGDAVEANFSIVDCSIQNLSVTTTNDMVMASWESKAPYFQVKILAEDGTTITNNVISEHSYSYKLEPGNYTLWIRPVDEALEYYVAPAVEQAFTIASTPTHVEVVESNETVYLYDIMGRMVDSKPANDNRTWNVPAAGVYIQSDGKEVVKVMRR